MKWLVVGGSAVVLVQILVVLVGWRRGAMRRRPDLSQVLADRIETPAEQWDALDRHLAEPEPVDDFALWAAELACRPRIRRYVQRMEAS